MYISIYCIYMNNHYIHDILYYIYIYYNIIDSPFKFEYPIHHGGATKHWGGSERGEWGAGQQELQPSRASSEGPETWTMGKPLGNCIYHWMDWLMGKSTGNHWFSHEIWGFPVIFPLNQSVEVYSYTVRSMIFPKRCQGLCCICAATMSLGFYGAQVRTAEWQFCDTVAVK